MTSFVFFSKETLWRSCPSFVFTQAKKYRADPAFGAGLTSDTMYPPELSVLKSPLRSPAVRPEVTIPRLLRGLAHQPSIPSMSDRNSCCTSAPVRRSDSPLCGPRKKLMEDGQELASNSTWTSGP